MDTERKQTYLRSTYLVANQRDYSTAATRGLQFVHPLVGPIVRGRVCHVIHHNRRLRATVVHGCQTVIPFLPGRVPDLESDVVAIHWNTLGEERRPDCALNVVVELILDKTDNETAFTNAGLPKKDQLVNKLVDAVSHGFRQVHATTTNNKQWRFRSVVVAKTSADLRAHTASTASQRTDQTPTPNQQPQTQHAKRKTKHDGEKKTKKTAGTEGTAPATQPKSADARGVVAPPKVVSLVLDVRTGTALTRLELPYCVHARRGLVW